RKRLHIDFVAGPMVGMPVRICYVPYRLIGDLTNLRKDEAGTRGTGVGVEDQSVVLGHNDYRVELSDVAISDDCELVNSIRNHDFPDVAAIGWGQYLC